MQITDCDLLIVGGGTGGCAAAMAATAVGLRVVMTEETDWVGGQLTSQAVPPDEHPWIESFGCTARYRAFRHLVRSYYKSHRFLTSEAHSNLCLNPGGGWVSRLCHEPRVALTVLCKMLEPGISDQTLDIRLETVAKAADVAGNTVKIVTLLDLNSGAETQIRALYVIDATELGDLLPLTGAEYVTGAECKQDTGEPHAVDGGPQPSNQQGLTWVFAMGFQTPSHSQPELGIPVAKPVQYEKWRHFQPAFWPGPLLGLDDIDPLSGRERRLPMFSDDWRCWFRYRQIVDPTIYDELHKPAPVTLVNWPMNDYFVEPIIDVTHEEKEKRLEDARQLSSSLLYMLQTELGFEGLHLCPDITGTATGFAKAPYIRESRRIKARFTLLEQHVSSQSNPGLDLAPEIEDSVGVGCYRIDLHPSTGGDSYIDTSSLPYQIPLGCLVPVRLTNLLPGCKNIGVTHITNGCTRLHPVEWNIGEAAGLLASFCIQRVVTPGEVFEERRLTENFQQLLEEQGVETAWPKLRAV